MRGIRQVASVEIPQFGASELGVDKGAVGEVGAKVKRLDYFVPALGQGRGDAHRGTRRRDRQTDRVDEEQRRVAGMSRIFAYITHKAGVADDTAVEMIAAARKIDASASPIAIVTGFGSELDAVCESLKASYSEIWKIANETLAYPNAEVIRQVLVKVVPAGSVLLVRARSLRHRSRSRAIDQAQCGVCTRRARYRRSTAAISLPCARNLAVRSARTFVATFLTAR